MAEALELIRALWSGDEITFEGIYYQTRKAKLYTPPASPIPIYVSTLVPNSATFAGEYGDGMITTGGKEPELYQQIIKNFEEAAQEEGKDPTKMPKLIELNVEYTDDTESAIKNQKKYWAGAFVPALYDQKIYTPKMSAQNGQVVGSNTIKKMACISGSSQDHVQYVKPYLDLGFDHLFFHSADPNQGTFLKKYGSDVLVNALKVKTCVIWIYFEDVIRVNCLFLPIMRQLIK